jgi:hypothetical protein
VAFPELPELPELPEVVPTAAELPARVRMGMSGAEAPRSILREPETVEEREGMEERGRTGTP